MSMPQTSFRIGDPTVGPAVTSLNGAVVWVPDPSGFDSMMRQNGPVGAWLKYRANDVRDLARALAPIDTGLLRDSIEIMYGKWDGGIYAEIGTDVYYGPFQELGTSRNPPHPYLRPALASVMGDITSRGMVGGYVDDVGGDWSGTEGRYDWDSDTRDWYEA